MMKKSEIFRKRIVNIEFICFACYNNVEIENPVQRYWEKTYCKQKYPEKLQILCKNILQVSSKVTVFKNYLGNSNFVKKLLK